MKKIFENIIIGSLLGCNHRIQYTAIPNLALLLGRTETPNTSLVSMEKKIMNLLKDPRYENKLYWLNLYSKDKSNFFPTFSGVAMNEDFVQDATLKEFFTSNNKLNTSLTIRNARGLYINLNKPDLLLRSTYFNILYDGYVERHELDYKPTLVELKSRKDVNLFIVEPNAQEVFNSIRPEKDFETQFNDADYWNDFYTRNDIPIDWYCKYNELAPHISPYIDKSDKILQIGCGNSGM